MLLQPASSQNNSLRLYIRQNVNSTAVRTNLWVLCPLELKGKQIRKHILAIHEGRTDTISLVSIPLKPFMQTRELQ
jgi:hypothetical protein